MEVAQVDERVLEAQARRAPVDLAEVEDLIPANKVHVVDGLVRVDAELPADGLHRHHLLVGIQLNVAGKRIRERLKGKRVVEVGPVDAVLCDESLRDAVA